MRFKKALRWSTCPGLMTLRGTENRSAVHTFNSVFLIQYCLAVLLAALASLALPGAAHAAISVQENIAMATDWPEPVEIKTDNANSGSSGVTVTPSSLLSETISPTRDMTLSALYFAYQLTNASAPGSFSVSIQEVPEGNNATSYAAGTNLLATTGYTFGLASTGGVQKILKLSFTGADQIVLREGSVYAVEISSTVSSVAFFRRGADAYWGGLAYSNRNVLLYSGSSRDLVMSVAGDINIITLEENIDPATVWPETVDIDTGDPAQVNNGVALTSGNVISQTITPMIDTKMNAFYLPYSTTAASATNSFTFKIQEVSGGGAVQTYTTGINLLGTTPVTFSLNSTGGQRRLLRFGFGGSNQITLRQGSTYAIEIASSASTATFFRRGASTYSGGALYVNRSAFNYPSTRDLSTAVVADVNAGYTYLPIPQSFSVQIVPGAGGSAEMAQDAAAGFKWARKGVYWYSTETSVGVYNFSGTDSIVANCAGAGITPWFTLYGGNSLYGEANDSVLTAAGRAGFAEFARRTALRYPQVKNFEIWNEPNLLSFWTPQPNIAAYCDLVAAASAAIKSVTPDAKIIGPALNVIPLGWLENAFRLGLLEDVDYVCVHPYRGSAPETALPDYAKMRSLVRKYAPLGKRIEIISGEWGYSTSSQVTTTVQAQYIARMFLTSLSAGMPLTNWYTWKDSADYFGLVDNNRSPKPSYNAIKTLSTVMAGYTFKERLATTDDAVYLLKFRNAMGKDAYAVWTTGADVTMNVPIAADSGSLYSIYGSVQGVSWGSSGPSITLTQSPQYLLAGVAAPVEVILDNSAGSGVTLTGSWSASTSTSGYYGGDYLHDGNTGKGTKSVLFTPTLTEAGTYEVFIRWTDGTSRANNTPVEIVHTGGTAQLQVNQQTGGGAWVSLGSYSFNAGTAGTLRISNTGTTGYVIADAIRFLK
jgi:polysaccharide biosynthesis protein PslG